MDLLKIITREEPIIGIEISDSNIRLAFLNYKKDKKSRNIKESSIEVRCLAETDLPDGVIVGGKIADRKIFIERLGNLLKKVKPKIKYAIISIPYGNIYSKLFSFPNTLSREKLTDTMRTVADFQLPLSGKDSYVDWEEENDKDNSLAFLATAPKKIIDDYISAVMEAGISPVAIEPHQMSIVRAVKPEPGSVLSSVSGKNGLLIFIFKNSVIRFSRFFPYSFLPKKKSADDEIRKVVDFYESDNEKIISRMAINKKESVKTKINFTERLELTEEARNNGEKWIVAIGAALRGIMPRSEDVLVSLMPVGTEEAYESQKAVAFTKFIANTIAAISLFFVFVYFASWFLMISIGKNFSNHISALNTSPLQYDAAKLESDAAAFNGLVGSTADILDTMPEWSLLLEELKSRTVDGISISNLSLPSPSEQITVIGSASNRAQLNMYKKSLEESSWFADINLPLTNLAQKESIPFSVSFILKDPSMLIIKSDAQ